MLGIESYTLSGTFGNTVFLFSILLLNTASGGTPLAPVLHIAGLGIAKPRGSSLRPKPVPRSSESFYLFWGDSSTIVTFFLGTC